MLKNYKYILQNLDCANCAKKIENKIAKDNRFVEVLVNFSLLELNFKTSIDNPLEEIKKIYSLEQRLRLGLQVTKSEFNKELDPFFTLERLRNRR